MSTAVAQPYLRSTRAAERAAAAEYLAHVLLDGDTPLDERYAVEAALTALADDPSPKVRAAVALGLAAHPRAPLHLVLHLAKDQPGVSAPLLLRSPVLSAEDLVELVATLDARGQTMIARRADLAAGVVAALCELGCREAILELASNDAAEVLPSSYRRMVDRFGTDAQLRESLIRDPRLPADCRHRLLMHVGDALRQSRFIQTVLGADRAPKLTKAACLSSSVTLLDCARPSDFPALVDSLRRSGNLTTGFVLRCVALGKLEFFIHIVAELAGVQTERARNIIVAGRELAVVSLFEKANLALSIHRPLLGGIHLWRDVARGHLIAGPREASQVMIDAFNEADAEQKSASVVCLLRQVQSETIRSAALEASRFAA